MIDSRLDQIRHLIISARDVADELHREQPSHPEDAEDVKKAGQYLRWALAAVARIQEQDTTRRTA